MAKYLALQGTLATPASFDISGDANGALEFEGGAYAGHEVNLLIQPNEHYILSSLLVNGVDVTESVSGNKYRVGPLSESGFVAAATFELYTAVHFAREFLAQTDPICSAPGENHLSALKLVWADLAAKYAILDADEKAKLVDSLATDEDILNALARYDYVCGKYNTHLNVNLVEFIEGVSVVHSSVPSALFGNENSASVVMITMLIVLLLSGGALAVLISRKRRKNIAK